MKRIEFTSQYRRDAKRVFKRGKDFRKADAVIEMLQRGERLPAKYREHALKGEFAGVRDCHIEPDWLLLYEITDEAIKLYRTGSHSDLF